MSVKIRASDLPYHVRQQLLDKLRDAAGDYQYTQLLDRFSEDGLLQMALDAAAGGGPGESSAKPAKAKRSSILPPLLFWGGMALVWVLLGPEAGSTVVGAIFVLIQVISALVALWESSSAKAVGMPFGAFIVVVGVGLALLAGIGIGVRKAGPWLASGVRGWWGWLGSRF